MNIILEEFPDLNDVQIEQFSKLKKIYNDWNNKINIISEVDSRIYGESLTSRSMYFCSGCPHNTSTVKLPEGDSAFGGIGCHLMAMFVDDGKAFGTTHMGGEGAQLSLIHI